MLSSFKNIIIVLAILFFLCALSTLNLLRTPIMMTAGEDPIPMDSQETTIMMQQDSQEETNDERHEGNAMDDDSSSLVDSNAISRT